MRYANIWWVLFVGMSLSCKDSGSGNLTANSEHEQEEALKKHIPTKVEKFKIDEVQVLTARKVRDPHSNYFKEYKALCKEWKPTKAVITEIFKNSKIVDGREYHYYYQVLPCYVIGRVVINCNIKAKYELNAGGSAVILLPDTAYFLGYYGNEHFLTYRADY